MTKQISKILSEVNYDLSKIKLVKCIGCHNEEDWIEYVLKNNYDEFDIIRIVEGAVEGRPKSTPDGHSTDRTLEIIRSFPDPDDKIELYTIGRPFKSLEEQKQIFLDVASNGEWLFIVDADEFYMEGDIERVRKAIGQHPEASEIIPTFLHFYRDKDHIRDFEGEWNLWHQRILKYREGMRYHTHPVATLKSGMCSYFSKEMQTDRYMMKGLKIFHYGHIKSKEEHIRKAEFYSKELQKFEGTGGDAAIAFNDKLDEFVNYKEDLSKILIYNDGHPEVLREHTIVGYVEEFYKDKQFEHYKKSSAYNGDPLPTIPQWMKYEQRMQPFFNLLEL